jgi:uncharacterized protein YecE (DUF72 family)
MEHSPMIYIGPAGWSYPDWKGIVYPTERPQRFSELEFITRYFNVVEINSTFYKNPSTATINGWLKTVAKHPQFRFCVKLWGRFTHDESYSSEDLEEFKASLRLIESSRQLLCVLIQFPWSFKRSDSSIKRLARLLDQLGDLPCAVEFRHSSWSDDMAQQYLAQRQVSFVNIDQPLLAGSLAPSAVVTAPIAYARLHGRNHANWFRESAGRDARYDYLYRVDELQQWIDNIESMSSQSQAVVIIFNNHFRGQAVVNALQLKFALQRQPMNAPSPLLQAYRDQLPFVQPDRNGLTLDLF